VSEVRAVYRTGSAKANRTESHTALCRTVSEYLALHGAWVFRVHGHLGQQRGIPDTLACLHGRLVAVEVKTGKGQLSGVQEVQRQMIEGAGGLFIECRNLYDVEEALYGAGLIAERSLWPRRGGEEP
jgi:hypothetical protein